CRDCHERFWVISRKVRVIGILALATTLAISAAALTLPLLVNSSKKNTAEDAAPTVDGMIKNQMDVFHRATDIQGQSKSRIEASTP
ncbi:MAG TPA: hypothetical protein VFO33_05625, partial [Casimicrobiaceae bacterium]|nr:hypothetical protein [Casimicrobiaceae bacterium]